ncbi:MAG: type II secretion system F family protein, partial [Acidimicrobiales bacterium]
MTLAAVFGLVLVVAGIVVVLSAARSSRVATSGLDYIRELDDQVTPDAFTEKLAEPFIRRALAPFGQGFLKKVSSAYPPSNLDRIHAQLLKAGLATSMRAEEFAVAQILAMGAGAVLALIYVLLGHPPARYSVLAFIILPLVGYLATASWLSRRIKDRTDSIIRELPDVLDLLAISVEAGLGLEQAMAVACAHFASPLSTEFSMTLKEMELGLSRRDALHNLKRRADIPDLANFILVLTQADALGMPIGRVLKVQGQELRDKRRQRARETAAKLPVKILLPLTIFIFPA